MTRYRLALLLILPVLRAQDAPPPIKPDAVDPALAPLLESLRHALLSSGRVTYAVAGDRTESQEITSILADARGCQATVYFDYMGYDGGAQSNKTALFFETIDTVEALTLKESKVRDGLGGFRLWAGGVYVLAINGKSSSLMFRSEGQATKAAEAVRRAAEICRAAPVIVNVAAGAPDLAATLQFITEKLNENGTVSFHGSYTKSDGSPLPDPSDPTYARHANFVDFSESDRITHASADPSTCQVRFNQVRSLRKGVVDTLERISFRRVEKLEVGTSQEFANRIGGSVRLKTQPVAYDLRLTVLIGGRVDLLFGDEELANRVAKAMLHAVELCGGGSKDPF